jgi:hypothetical protein
VQAGGAETETLEQAISGDLAAAADRRFDDYQIDIHAAAVTRAIHPVLP